MCFKRLFGWFGRRIGWGMRSGRDILKALIKWISLLILIFIGAVLALLGNFIIFLLGAFLSFCVLFLKFFAKFTERLMITTKWASSKVAEYTESFYEGVTSTFKKEEEYLEQELKQIFHSENN